MYVKNRYISESGRLIYDVLETENILSKEGFLVRVDIEKALWFGWAFFFISCFTEVWFWGEFSKMDSNSN